MKGMVADMEINLQELDNLQITLSKDISLKNRFNYMEEISLVAGADVAYWTENDVDYGVCCICVIDFQTRTIMEKATYSSIVDFPYIPGYLSFRELPLILETVNRLTTNPDLYMLDGNGYLHKRHMGLATHASLSLDKPAIGIAKTYFHVDQAHLIMPENDKGAYADIMINSELYGRVLRTRKNVKPIFISSGNWIDIETATMIAMHFIDAGSRQPIPTRYADITAKKHREELRRR